MFRDKFIKAVENNLMLVINKRTFISSVSTLDLHVLKKSLKIEETHRNQMICCQHVLRLPLFACKVPFMVLSKRC